MPLLHCLCLDISQDDAAPSRWASRRKQIGSSVVRRDDRSMTQGAWPISCDGAAQLILHAVKFFLFCFAGDDAHRVVLVGLNRPFATAIPSPAGLHPKSQGHPLSGPFVESHQGLHPHACPRSGFLAASRRGCAHPFAAAPRVGACPLVAAPVVCARPSAAAPRRRLVYALAFLRQPHAFALGYALRPGHQRLELSGDSSFSLTSESDASGSLGQGWCNVHERGGALPVAGAAPALAEGTAGIGLAGKAGQSPGINGTPPAPCRFSACNFSGFEASGRRSSVAAPSPG